MLHLIFEWIQPLLTLGLELGGIAALGFVARYVPLVGRLYADQRNRDALHRAIDTGVDLALAGVETAARAVPGVQAIDTALGYVQRSVPGALKHFFGDNAAAAQAHLRDMIEAKLAAKADPLAAALRAAGAPAVAP